MNRTTSVFLDAARFIAALVVFVGHLSGERLSGGLGWQVGAFMSDSVAVFFVLSGYVIAMATSRREQTLRSYGLSRASRLLSVAVPALLTTVITDAIGRSLNAGSYNASWGYSDAHPVLSLLLSATFTGQCWWLNIVPGSNLPWWSLCYEVFYYAAFAAFVFGGRWRWLMTGGVLLVMGPRIALLLPLWLAGVVAYRLRLGTRMGGRGATALLLCCGMAAILFILAAHRLPVGAIPGIPEPLDPLRAYLVGMLFLLTVVATEGLPAWAACGPRLERMVRSAASVTFTLYLAHLPIAQAIAASSGLPPGSSLNRALVFGGTGALVVALAAAGEWRKAWWHRKLARAFAAKPTPQPVAGASD